MFTMSQFPGNVRDVPTENVIRFWSLLTRSFDQGPRSWIFVNYSFKFLQQHLCICLARWEGQLRVRFRLRSQLPARQDPLCWLRSARQDHLLQWTRQFVVSSECSGNLCVGFWECERCSLYEYSVIETGPMYVYCGLRELCLSWEKCTYFEKLVHVWKFCAHARNEKQISWSYSDDIQVQGHHLDPGGRGGGGLHAGPILLKSVFSLRVGPGLVLLNDFERACFKFESRLF